MNFAVEHDDYIAVPTDHRVKLKESEKKNNFLNLAGEFKKKL